MFSQLERIATQTLAHTCTHDLLIKTIHCTGTPEINPLPLTHFKRAVTMKSVTSPHVGMSHKKFDAHTLGADNSLYTLATC